MEYNNTFNVSNSKLLDYSTSISQRSNIDYRVLKICDEAEENYLRQKKLINEIQDIQRISKQKQHNIKKYKDRNASNYIKNII